MLDSNPGQDLGVTWSKVRGQKVGYDVSPGSLYRFKGQGSTHCFDNKRNLARYCCFSMRIFYWFFRACGLSFRSSQRLDRDLPLSVPGMNLRPILGTSLRIRVCVSHCPF